MIFCAGRELAFIIIPRANDLLDFPYSLIAQHTLPLQFIVCWHGMVRVHSKSHTEVTLRLRRLVIHCEQYHGRIHAPKLGAERRVVVDGKPNVTRYGTYTWDK